MAAEEFMPAPLYSPAYGPFRTGVASDGGLRSIVGHNEMAKPSLWRSATAEFLATLAFVWIGTGATVWTAQSIQPYGAASVGDYLVVAFAWGFAYAVTVYATQHLTAGYQNPAAVIGLVLVGKLPLLRGLVYIIAQIAGAIVGAGLVKGVNFHLFNSAFGGATLHNGALVTKGGAFLAEIIGTAILVYIILASLDLGHGSTPYGRHIGTLSPLMVGIAYFTLVLTLVRITGGALNPVRSFGPAIILGSGRVYNDQWIYWFGPIVGALFGALFYELFNRNSYIPVQNDAYGGPKPPVVGPEAGMGEAEAAVV